VKGCNIRHDSKILFSVKTDYRLKSTILDGTACVHVPGRNQHVSLHLAGPALKSSNASCNSTTKSTNRKSSQACGKKRRARRARRAKQTTIIMPPHYLIEKT